MYAARKILDAPDIGDPMREISARARFPRLPAFVFAPTKVRSNFFQVFAIAGKNREPSFDLMIRSASSKRRRFADDSQIDFTRPRAVAKLNTT